MDQIDDVTISEEVILTKIFLIRGQKVMIDRDLAELYGVETRALNQEVRRNLKRFPEDFMFQLTEKEFNNWKSQIVISKSERMSIRKAPLVFTEQGIAMLSSVLNGDQAISVKYPDNTHLHYYEDNAFIPERLDSCFGENTEYTSGSRGEDFIDLEVYQENTGIKTG